MQMLQEAVAESEKRSLSTLERLGLLKAFTFTHELAWNVLKDYVKEEGLIAVVDSENPMQGVFQLSLIDDRETWVDMLNARNLTLHAFDPDVAQALADDICLRFYPAIGAFAERFAAVGNRCV